MNKCLNELTNKLYELYRVYEDYAFNSYVKNENKYTIVIHFREKNIIHYALFEKKNLDEYEIFDEVNIDFERERKQYEAVSLQLFAKAIGNVMIYTYGNSMYYNEKHKPYTLIIADDKEISHQIDRIIMNQEIEHIIDHPIIESVCRLVKIKKMDWPFLSQIEDRTMLTNELLKNYERQRR